VVDLHDHLRRYYALEGPFRPITGMPITDQQNATLQVGDWFVKLFAPARVPEPLIEQSLRVQEAVRTLGLPAPQVRRSRDQALYTPFGDQYLAVMAFVPGRSLLPGRLDQAQAAAVGDVLARLHGAMARLTPGDSRPAPPDGERVLSEWQALRQAADAGVGAPAELNRFVAEAAAYREAMWTWFPPTAVDWADQPWQMIHGDFHGGNLRWGEPEGVRAVIDFDGCGPGYLASEVAEAWLLNCRREAEVPAPEVEVAFLLGYRRCCQLTRAQWLAIPRAWLTLQMARTWPVSQVYEQPGSYDPDRALRVAIKRERQVRWVGEHLADMAAMLQHAWDAGW
jgi:Ser/Thr protein kinase RdoA (MazF antagonist)